jgi:acyl-CoA dehydrogenase
MPAQTGPLTIGPVLKADRLGLSKHGGDWKLSGTLHRIPWGRDAHALVAIADCEGQAVTVVVPRPAVERADRNYAFEPRDDLRFDGLVLDGNAVGTPGTGFDRDDLLFRGAIFRALLMTGALERILVSTTQYAQQRVAFGRPIAKFQAVQQQVAALATEVAAASAAAQAAVDAIDNPQARFVIAAAKARVGEAAGISAAIAHQVHAAIGFTHEHSLHLHTRRLWSWRDEFGSESDWFAWVGREAAKVGGEALWAHITDASCTGTSN